MTIYEYDDRLRIDGESWQDTVHVQVSTQPDFGASIHLPNSERRAAAQALAGDNYIVIPITADDRPASRQEIAKAKADALREAADDLYTDNGPEHELSTRRWVRERADELDPPEPDPAAVEVLSAIIKDIVPDSAAGIGWDEFARELVRRGVEVPTNG